MVSYLPLFSAYCAYILIPLHWFFSYIATEPNHPALSALFLHPSLLLPMFVPFLISDAFFFRNGFALLFQTFIFSFFYILGITHCFLHLRRRLVSFSFEILIWSSLSLSTTLCVLLPYMGTVGNGKWAFFFLFFLFVLHIFTHLGFIGIQRG